MSGATVVGPGGQIDVADRAGRKLGEVSIDGDLEVAFPAGLATDTAVAAVTAKLAEVLAELEAGDGANVAARIATLAATVAGGKVQTDALTDLQLRAAAVLVDTGLTTQTDALTDTELRATPVDVADRDTVLEVLDDQSGPGVLTFTFDAPVSPWVSVDVGDPVRVTGPDDTPTGTLGVPVAAGSPFPLPFVTDEILVLAAAGQVVTAYGTG